MNALFIPCYNRPEFLWHCLDNLTRCEGIENIHVIFKPDSGYHPDNLRVIEQYTDRLTSYEVRAPLPPVAPLTKQSKNVLDGYKYAATQTDELIYMVEEDVMVSTDFLTYHEAIHTAEPGLFASLSTKNPNRNVTTTEDPEAYYLTTGDYCSLGVCMRASVFNDHIDRHMTGNYYRNPIRYMGETFPNSDLNKSQAEQDGLIRRIQHESELPLAYPHLPRAFHSGFYGYNRRQYITGTLEKKIQRIADTIYDPANMLAASLSPAYYQDSIPVNLNTPKWKTLRNCPTG
jgi:hypothetical protein